MFPGRLLRSLNGQPLIRNQGEPVLRRHNTTRHRVGVDDPEQEFLLLGKPCIKGPVILEITLHLQGYFLFCKYTKQSKLLLDFFQKVVFDIFDFLVNFDNFIVKIVYMQTTPPNPEFEKTLKSQFLNSRLGLSE